MPHERDTPRCIYCLESKPVSLFNREHVLPQSFGRFEQNLVLECVCSECNSHFGHTLDEKLSRDSFEALDRVRSGVKNAAEFRMLGRRTTLAVRAVKDGPLKGAHLLYVPAPDGQSLALDFLPQLGFAHSPDGPFEWYLLHDIPSKDEMTANGYGRETVIRFEGCSYDDGQEALAAGGYSCGNKGTEYHHINERLAVETTSLIADIDYRAVSKIALNYLASVAGPHIALMPEFNNLRRYVRAAVSPRERPVDVRDDPGTIESVADGAPAVGHYLAIQWDGNRVLVQLSLFLRLRYLITLSTERFLIPVSLSSAHFFDLRNRVVVPIDSQPLFQRTRTNRR